MFLNKTNTFFSPRIYYSLDWKKNSTNVNHLEIMYQIFKQDESEKYS